MEVKNTSRHELCNNLLRIEVGPKKRDEHEGSLDCKAFLEKLQGLRTGGAV